MDQSNLLKNITEFYNKSRPRTLEDKDNKRYLIEGAYARYEGRNLTLNAYKSVIFTIKETQGKGLKILTKINKCFNKYFKDYQYLLHK